eukprot:gene10104-11839_t
MNMFFLADTLPLTYTADNINEYRELLAYFISKSQLFDPRYEVPKSEPLPASAEIADLSAESTVNTPVKFTPTIRSTPQLQTTVDAVLNVRQRLWELQNSEKPAKRGKPVTVTIGLLELENMQEKIKLLESLLEIVPN